MRSNDTLATRVTTTSKLSVRQYMTHVVHKASHARLTQSTAMNLPATEGVACCMTVFSTIVCMKHLVRHMSVTNSHLVSEALHSQVQCVGFLCLIIQ